MGGGGWGCRGGWGVGAGRGVGDGKGTRAGKGGWAGKRVGELQPHFGQPVTPSLSMGPAIFIGQSQALHDGEFSSQIHRRQPFVTSILYCLQLKRQKTTGHSGVAGGDDKSKRKNMCKYFTMQIKVNKGLIFDTKIWLIK